MGKLMKFWNVRAILIPRHSSPQFRRSANGHRQGLLVTSPTRISPHLDAATIPGAPSDRSSTASDRCVSRAILRLMKTALLLALHATSPARMPRPTYRLDAMLRPQVLKALADRMQPTDLLDGKTKG